MKSKQFISAAMVLLLMVSLPVSALAATYNIADGDITVNAAAAQQTVTQNGTTVEDSAPVITGASENTCTVAINAEAGATARVTLSDVEINACGISKAAVSTGGDGKVTIELDGENKLTGGMNHAGLEKNNGGDLTISDSNSNEGSLVAAGGSNGAGIGGGDEGNGSNISINGGNVNATGGRSAAGIGGGYEGNGSNITITGSNVTALGGADGAGIGGGYEGNGSNITITGGNVNATGGANGAGIGGGDHGHGDNIMISGSIQLSVQGAESEFDVSRLTPSGKIMYYAPDANMGTDQPERILVGTYVPVPARAPSARAESPAYRVTDRNGSSLAYTAVQKDGVLTVTVDAEFAILTGTLGGIETLKALGVEKLTFVTGGAVSTFALADLPESGSRGDVYALTHDGGTVTFTLGAENTDLRGILETALG